MQSVSVTVNYFQIIVYLYSPVKIPDTFHELKLPPSLIPIGIATENRCFPGNIS